MLHSVFVVTLILGAIWPLLNTVAMLLVLLPSTLVSTAVEVSVDSITICFVISPLTLIHVAFRMNETAKSISHSILPESVVTGAIRPDLNAASVLLIRADEPLALVNCAIFKILDRSDNALFSLVYFIDCPVKRLKLIDYLLI